jgi:hypothetical protein
VEPPGPFRPALPESLVQIALAVALALALVIASVAIHYEVLRWTSRALARLRTPPRTRILFAITGVLVAHLVEVVLFAGAYHLMHAHFGLGTIDGEFSGRALDYVYFSMTTYTTLGVGDLYPHGSLRLVAGVESLLGLVLIAWSASFTYVTMETYWEEHPAGPGTRRRD